MQPPPPSLSADVALVVTKSLLSSSTAVAARMGTAMGAETTGTMLTAGANAITAFPAPVIAHAIVMPVILAALAAVLVQVTAVLPAIRLVTVQIAVVLPKFAAIAFDILPVAIADILPELAAISAQLLAVAVNLLPVVAEFPAVTVDLARIRASFRRPPRRTRRHAAVGAQIAAVLPDITIILSQILAITLDLFVRGAGCALVLAQLAQVRLPRRFSLCAQPLHLLRHCLRLCCVAALNGCTTLGFESLHLLLVGLLILLDLLVVTAHGLPICVQCLGIFI